MDKRKQVFINRLSDLPVENIIHLRDNIDKVCFDTFNYDAQTKTYCPIAIALRLDEIPNPTNELIGIEIGKWFHPVNALKGVEGEFYTTNRKEDLLSVCNEIIGSKVKI